MDDFSNDLIKATFIGVVDEGIDGRDMYFAVTSLDESVTKEHIRQMFEREERMDSSGPGSLFCTGVHIVEQEWSRRAYIVTVALKYDC